MAYPYKKMTSQDCDYIRSVTAPDRVWVGEEIASEYYRDEMPEYGVYQPDLYVEVVNKEEVSAIMAYSIQRNGEVTKDIASITIGTLTLQHFLKRKWKKRTGNSFR